MKNKLKCGSRQYRIDKFGDLIELEISLINEIRGLIKNIPKFRADSG